LASLSEKLNQPLSINEVIESIGAGAVRLSAAQHAAVYLRQGADEASCAWSKGLSPAYINGVVGQLEKVPGGRLLRQAETILIPNLQQLPEESLLSHLAQAEGIAALGLWPMIYEGTVIAAIGLYFDQPQVWTPGQQEILTAFTRQAAIALQNARLFHETRWRALQQEALNRMIAVAVSAPDLSSLLEDGLGLVMEALDVHVGGIWVDGHHAIRGCPPQVDLSDPKISHDFISSVTETLVIPDWQLINQPGYNEWKPLIETCGVRPRLLCRSWPEASALGFWPSGRKIHGRGTRTSLP